MSLLLDALRKSEAQRRRGQAPGLELGPMPGGARSARPARRWPLWLIVAGLVGLVAWQWPRIVEFSDRWRDAAPAVVDSESDAGTPAVDGGSPIVGVVPAPNSQATADVRRAVGEVVDRPGEPSIPSRTRPVAEPVAESSARPPSPDTGPATASAESAPATAADESPDRPTAAALQRAEAIRREAERLRSAAAEPVQPAARPGAAATPDAGPEAGFSAADGEAGRSSASAQEDTANYLRPWELPQARRAAFPELELTVHFYSDQPGERFVLINGERYGQGDRVEGEVRLREILRRGIVVEFEEYLVLVE